MLSGVTARPASLKAGLSRGRIKRRLKDRASARARLRRPGGRRGGSAQKGAPVEEQVFWRHQAFGQLPAFGGLD